jgi:tRNA(fMet)-specific endonuclease VapC
VRIALDANRYVDLCKGVTETVALLEEAEAVMLPFVVLGELRAGFALGRRQVDNERVLRRFLVKPA